MADVLEKAKKKFASDSANAKGTCNFVKDFLPFKSVTTAHLFYVCNGKKNSKIIEKLRKKC